MKHLERGILAVVIAAALTGLTHFYGAHDLLGFFVVVVGYPGLLASERNNRFNDVLFTVVNWLFYFLLFEGVAALKQRLSN
jgi:hypothetical protein